ncbi:hypothetical protein [Burkholderia dolosa]|nr:hypothetical protein [Burkholderia dolosa]MBR8058969.1 hypothetical protein [Burkholderia dolosa]
MALADLLFGGEAALTTINMSAIYRLVGDVMASSTNTTACYRRRTLP